MAVVAVFLLAAAGIGLLAVGIVALRDEPPRWMLRIRHPGRLLALGLVSVVAALIVNSLRYSIEEELRDDTGQEVSCREIGPLEIQGEERQVYACVASQSGGGHIGCYARDGDGVVEVTVQAQRPGAFAERPDC